MDNATVKEIVQSVQEAVDHVILKNGRRKFIPVGNVSGLVVRGITSRGGVKAAEVYAVDGDAEDFAGLSVQLRGKFAGTFTPEDKIVWNKVKEALDLDVIPEVNEPVEEAVIEPVVETTVDVEAIVAAAVAKALAEVKAEVTQPAGVTVIPESLVI